MFYCGFGSGSGLGKVLVSVPVPVPVPVPAPNPDNIWYSFSTTKNLYKSGFFNVRSSIVSQKVGLSFWIF